VQQQVRPHWQMIEADSADKPNTLQQIDGQQAHLTVDSLGEEILSLLADARDMTFTVCPTTDSSNSWKHYRSRGLKCARKQLMKLKHAVNASLRALVNTNPAQADRHVNVTELRAQAAAEHKAATMMLHSTKHGASHSTHVSGAPPAALEAVKQLVQEHKQEHPGHTDLQAHQAVRDRTRAQLNEIDQQCPRLAQQQTICQTPKQLERNQRKGNKQALGKHKPNPVTALRIVKTSEGAYATTADTVIPTVESTATRKFAAAEPNGKQGAYLPDNTPRNYPFDHPSGEEFKQYKNLMQRTAPATAHRHWLHSAIDDELEFEHCLAGLANNKAPGPDDVCNEIIKALPPAGHQTLHNMIRIMWATGLTPDSWKCSTTLLLFKHKGTPLELKYYRWIGLELTVYKLWTRMVTRAMADRAERLGMLSSSQSGFRNKRSTAEQVEMMIIALEDAHLFKRNIFLLQADLTEAFDTISHDKLLMILYDLHFPTDAIEVVKDLYTETRTSVQTPYGKTKDIPIEKGTIQGDSLSPFLFVLYMEPLLRWLRAGNKGYQAGALAHLDANTQQANQIADITYADDINILTGGPSGLANLKHQAEKLSQYADCGHFNVNNTKTTVTGALHGTQPNQPYDEEALQGQLRNTISIQHKKITYQSPKQPFRHLGVLLTMDLNYKPQLQATLEQVRSMTQNLRKSLASASQKQRIIEQSIRPAITYAFAAAPYTLAEIKCLDSQLTRATKQAHGLPNSMSTAAAHLRKLKGGLGCHSLEVEYNKIGVERLTRSLNNAGTLGVLSNELYKHQCRGMDQLTAHELPYTLRYSMRVRQLLAYQRCHLRLCRNGLTLDEMQSRCTLAASLEQAIDAQTPWNKRLVEDVHSLSCLGIQTIEQMLNPSRTMVAPVSELTRLLGAHKVKPKHKTAWNRISCLLITGRPHRAGDSITVKDTPLASRRVHPDILHTLRTLWPTNPTAKPNTIVHMLTELQHSNRTTIHAIRNKMTLSAEEEMHIRGNQVLGSNVRISQAMLEQPHAKTYKTRSATKTGYELVEAKQRPLKQAAAADAPQLKQELLGLIDQYSPQPESIVGVDTGGFAQATSRTPDGCSTQRQVCVTWAESIQPGYILDVFKLFKYRLAALPEHLQPDDPALQGIQWPCEICTQRNTEADTVTCEVCHRRYHLACIPGATPDHGTSYTCRQCSRAGWTAGELPNALKLYKAKWQDSYESEEVVRTAGTAEAIAQLLPMTHNPAQQQATARADDATTIPAAAAANPTPPNDSVYNITVGQARRRKLVVHTLPINPHADIEPTGSQEVFVRPVRHKEGPDGAACCHRELACVYHADGRCEHMLCPATAAVLRQRYQHMQRRLTKLMKKLKATSFEQDLMRLVTRYRPGNCTPGSSGVPITEQQQCTLPPALKDYLFYELGIKQERFASPLNAHPACTKYYSLFKEDYMFGAQGNAYSTKWTGASLAVPDFDHYSAEQAVKWAVYSAKCNVKKPTFTMLFLPSFSDSRDGSSCAQYMHWVDRHPECCRRLLIIPSSRMLLQPPGNKPHAHPSKLKWNTMVLAVGNKAGFRQCLPFWEQEQWDTFKERMGQIFPNAHENGQPAQPLKWRRGTDNWGDWLANRCVLPRDVNNTTVPCKFRTLPNDCDLRPRVPPLDRLVIDSNHPRDANDGARNKKDMYILLGLTPEQASDTGQPQPGEQTRRAVQDAIAMLRRSPEDIPPLQHNWRDFIYTDGSVLPEDMATEGPGIGAAVHIPANPQTRQPAITIHIGCSTPERHVDTINRAELAAISVAMDEAAAQQTAASLTSAQAQRVVHIATDSLGSIRQVFKANTRPQDMQEHRHLSLITNIAEKVASQAGTIHLWKVKSHIGIVGNEQADIAAGQVAKGELPKTQILQFTQPSNDRDSMAWPHTEHITESGDIYMTPLATCEKHWRKLPCTRGSWANPTKNPYTSVAGCRCALKCIMNPATSSSQTPRWPTRPRSLSIKPGGATYPPRKCSADGTKRETPAAFACCAARKTGDTMQLVACFCKALSQTVTLRHNDAGAAIVKAIRKGSRGGELIASDVGLRTRCNAEELAHDGKPMTTRRKFTAADFEAPGMQGYHERVKRALINQQSVPDALLYDEEYNDFIIVEVKYCRDTDRATQSAKATKQHQHLRDSIAEPPDPEVSQPEERDTCMADLRAAIASNADTVNAPPTVRQATILLGVTGVIYTDTVQLLTALGISGPALKTLLTDLHYTAIHGLERIWRQRRALIKQLGHLRWVNYSKSKKSRMKRAFTAPSHRKHNKKRKYWF
jgi:ribonuclease HI